MAIGYLKILAIFNYLFFIVYILFGKNTPHISFIKYILYSFPLLGIKIIGELGGFECITITFLLFFYKYKKKKITFNRFYSILVLIFIADISIGFLHATFPIDYSTIAELLSVLITIFFCKILAEECLFNDDMSKKVLSIMMTMLLVSFVFLLCQILFGPTFSLSIVQNPNIVSSEGIRFPSFMSDPQVYSQYLSIMSFICLYKTIDSPSKSWYLLLFIGCVLGILLAGGRAAFIGFTAGLFIIFIFSKLQIKTLLIGTSVLLLSLSFLLKDYFMIFKRGTDINEAYGVRYAIWQDASDIFKNYPFFGIGINNYAKYVSIHYPDQVWFRENEYIPFDHPESGYLKLLTEYGLIGFACIFLIIIFILIKGFVKFNKEGDYQYILLIAAIVSWLIGFYSTFSIGDTRFKIIISSIICLLMIKDIKQENKKLLPVSQYKK